MGRCTACDPNIERYTCARCFPAAEWAGAPAPGGGEPPGAALDWRDGSGNHIVAVVGSTDDEAQLQAAYRLLHQKVTVTYTDVRH